jgi:ABC-type transport system involved in cytochrome c biogenesis ATPase subunit
VLDLVKRRGTRYHFMEPEKSLPCSQTPYTVLCLRNIHVPIRMLSPGMLRRVALARTDVSEEHISLIVVTRISELETTLAVTSKQFFAACICC